MEIEKPIYDIRRDGNSYSLRANTKTDVLAEYDLDLSRVSLKKGIEKEISVDMPEDECCREAACNLAYKVYDELERVKAEGLVNILSVESIDRVNDKLVARVIPCNLKFNQGYVPRGMSQKEVPEEFL